MQATKLLKEHFQMVNGGFRAIIGDMTEQEWTARPLLNMNPPAWTLWHLARTQDAVVQTAIRGVPEVITQSRWASCGALATPGIGIGQTTEEVNAIAYGINRADISAYADAVTSEVLAWLVVLSDDDLDAVPDVVAHSMGHPVYQVPAILETAGMPVWAHLLELCLIHSQDHLAELDIIKQQLRLPTATSPASP